MFPEKLPVAPETGPRFDSPRAEKGRGRPWVLN
jgi:hypothetical protein